MLKRTYFLTVISERVFYMRHACDKQTGDGF